MSGRPRSPASQGTECALMERKTPSPRASHSGGGSLGHPPGATPQAGVAHPPRVLCSLNSK